MIWVFVEDSGSGFDFISTIIERVIKPVVPYTVLSLQGSSNIKQFRGTDNDGLSFESRVMHEKYNIAATDICVFFVDDATFIAETFDFILNSCKVNIFVCDYYCFEQLFYEYDFDTFITGDSKYRALFEDYRNILSHRDFERFEKSKQSANSITKWYNIKQFANRLLTLYFSTIPCVLVNKLSYQHTLNYLLGTKSLSKAYYNNCCNKDKQKGYCDSMHSNGRCNKMAVSRGNVANLRRFYENTSLSSKLRNLRSGQYEVTLHDLLCDSKYKCSKELTLC